jgi:integrase
MRANREGSVVREGARSGKPTGRWIAQISIGGGKYRRTVHHSEKDAVAGLKLLRKQSEAGVSVDNTMTVGAWLDQWLDTIEHSDKYSAETVQGYRARVNNWIRPQLGGIKLAALRPSDIDRLMTYLRDKYPHRNGTVGLSASARRKARTILLTALRYAVRDRIMDASQLANVRESDSPEAPHKIEDALTADEARAVLAAVQGDRLEALFVLALKLGFRKGELLSLQWSDVDRQAGTVTIEPANAKTKVSAGTVPLVNGTHALMVEHHKRQSAERLAAGPLWHDTGLVFTTADGRRIPHMNLWRYWHKALERAGVTPRRFHASRHTAATLMLEDGVPLEVVSKVLRHASIAITADVYAEVRTDLIRGSLDQHYHALDQ